MNRILLVEDEPGIVLALGDDLRIEGYDVEVAGDGVTGLSLARSSPFDLIILDLMLPGKDGLSVCRELRRAGFQTPVLMLTAKALETEKVIGLEMGADDYVTKPYGTLELRAREGVAAARFSRERRRGGLSIRRDSNRLPIGDREKGRRDARAHRA